MTGFVYFVRCNDRIKIGFSLDPHLRFNKIKSDAPYPCEMLGTVSALEYSEAALHEKFSRFRAHGEWFFAAHEIIEFIAPTTAADVAPSILLETPKPIARSAAARIIMDLGGLTKVARIVRRPLSTVQGWKTRGRIPQDHWADLISHVRANGGELNVGDFLDREVAA